MKLTALLILIFFLSGICEGRTFYVGSTQQFKTITAAINSAATGDTVIVQPGIYKEKNIVIKKPVSLIGINYPEINGENKYEIISIKSANVMVSGFSISHSGYATMQDPAGIKIYDTRNVSIINNHFDDTFFGIYVQYSVSCTIKNNRLKSYGILEQEIGNGIHCWKSDSMLIDGNTITGHRDGIYFEFVTNSMIRNNKSEKNIRYGLHFMFSHNDTYANNSFVRNGAGVAVMFTHGVKMYNNHFDSNWGDAAFGLLLKEISDSKIDGNTFASNTTGVLMEGASRIEMKNNIFRNNGWAIKIQASCMDVVVTSNNFIGNSFDVATNGSLVLNTFKNNYWDKYEGYDLNKDMVGDIPYRPVSLFSMIIATNPQSMILFRSILVTLLDRTEKILPSLIPENLIDNAPLMRPVKS